MLHILDRDNPGGTDSHGMKATGVRRGLVLLECDGAVENYDTETGVSVSYTFNSDGPVFGPNGEYELDPDNDQCVQDFYDAGGLPVFGTCKNSCKGGKIKAH